MPFVSLRETQIALAMMAIPVTRVFAGYSCLCGLLMFLWATRVFVGYSCLCGLLMSLWATHVFAGYFAFADVS